MQRSIFSEGLELARLPFFSLKEGSRLLLVDGSVGPIIDVHTHLALAYVLPLGVDLRTAVAPTEHYLPMRGRTLDLDIYINKNFTKGDLKRMKRDLTLMSLTPWGMRRTHTVPNLLGEMKDLNIVHSVSLPIDYPTLSSNATTYLSTLRGNDAFIAFGSVHPYCRDMEGTLDRQASLGARGIKVHPAVQLVRPDNHRAMRLYRLCAMRKLPVLFHCGPVGIEPRVGRRLSQVVHYEKPIAENPDTCFILGHSGALQMEQALDYCIRYPNVYLDITSQSLSNIRAILHKADQGRVLFGSDWPFYHQATSLAKVLVATENDGELRRKVLYENAARLFGIKDRPDPADTYSE